MDKTHSESEYGAVMDSLKSYKSAIRKIEYRKGLWYTEVQSIIFNALVYIARNSDTMLNVERSDEVDGSSTIILRVRNGGTGSSVKRPSEKNEIIKTEASLVFCQSVNGNILPVFVYPFIEGWMDKEDPLMRKSIAPADLVPNVIFAVVIDFLDTMRNWEEEANFSSEFPRKPPAIIPTVTSTR
jgi:hypothetical protein